MFTKRQVKALLAIVKYRRHPKYPSVVEWINNDDIFIPRNTKGNENSTTACNNIVLSDKSQIKKNSYHMIPFI